MNADKSVFNCQLTGRLTVFGRWAFYGIVKQFVGLTYLNVNDDHTYELATASVKQDSEIKHEFCILKRIEVKGIYVSCHIHHEFEHQF